MFVFSSDRVHGSDSKRVMCRREVNQFDVTKREIIEVSQDKLDVIEMKLTKKILLAGIKF